MLYIIATPIGNLSEMSPRAIELLKNVKLIASEDTRHSKILLNHFNISTKLCSYQKFNEEYCSEKLIELLKNGEDIALISDAGMPLISDPGKILLDKCIDLKIPYTVVSGACALINGLLMSGLHNGEFTFLGFLPDKLSLRKQKIAPYINCPSTLVFYSPVQSIEKDLTFLFKSLGDRKASIIRELTKKFEQVIHFNLSAIPKITLKGEFVLVVEGYKKIKSNLTIEELYNQFILNGHDKMEAMKLTAKEKGISKSVVYKQIQSST